MYREARTSLAGDAQLDTARAAALHDARRGRLVRLLAAATFLIFFQAYMVAPLIPRLASAFGVAAQTIGLIVPAYLIEALRLGFVEALAIFSAVQLVAACAAIPLFRLETAPGPRR